MNEEKILNYLIGMESRIDSRFERLESEISDLKQGYTDLKQGYVDLQKGQADLQKGQDDLKQGYADLQKEQAETNQRLGKLEEKTDRLAEKTDRLEVKVDKIEADVAYAVSRSERTSENTAYIEVEHGGKIGALFDMVSLLQDTTNETNVIVKALYEKQENQELSIKWIDSRMKKAAI